MTRTTGLILFLLALLPGMGGCRESGRTLDVQLTVRLEKSALPTGGPLELIYRWQVPTAAEPDSSDDFHVLAHFWGEDGEILWQDDHQPPIPTSQWHPGSTIEYSRIHFVSDSIPPGEITLTTGLYDQQSGQKIRLAGNEESEHKLEYGMTRLELLPADRLPIIVYGEGWYNWETGKQNDDYWRWCRGEAVCWVESPDGPCSLFMEVQAPVQMLDSAQRVTLEVEGTPVATLELENPWWVVKKIPIPEALTRDRGCFRLKLIMDKVVTPVEPEKSTPGRELGLNFKQLVVY